MKSDLPQRIVVVGASAAGLKAAARARRLLPEAQVTVLDQAREVSVGACGLPYFVSGDIEDSDALRRTAFGVLRDEDYFARYKAVEVRTEHRVERIDVAEHEVVAVGPDGAAHRIGYDALVLATGARPRRLPEAVGSSARVRTFKTLDDARTLRRGLESGEIGSVGIVGGGFIGCELAEAFGGLWGCEVTLCEAAPHVLPGVLDEEMALLVQAHLRERGVALRLGACVEGLTERGAKVELATGGGTVAVDCVVVAVGVEPSTELARAAGLAIGSAGGIVVRPQDAHELAWDLCGGGLC